MILRSAALAVVGVTTAALAACSSAGIPATTTPPASASVTQTAPSVWSAPDTDSQSLAGTSSAAASDGAASTGTLPGLSKACSEAIRAQLAVNNLFTEALQVGPATATTAPSPATSTAAPTGDAATTGVTAARVTTVFDEILPSIPAPLAVPLDTLRRAAESIVGKPVVDIPAALSSPAVTDAMHTFKDYISECEPAATD